MKSKKTQKPRAITLYRKNLARLDGNVLVRINALHNLSGSCLLLYPNECYRLATWLVKAAKYLESGK